MKSNINISIHEEKETNYALYLSNKGYLPGPQACSCGNKTFVIQNDSYSKTSGCIFRCSNYKCRKRYPIRINSLFAKFPNQRLDVISEILVCFLCLEKNVKKTVEYLKESKGLNVSKRIVALAFKEFRDIIYKYLNLVYHTEILGDTNYGGYFAADESLFGHRDNTQIWILGIIETSSKKFRIEGSLSRNADTLNKFISKFVKSGNTIISDNWAGYDYLDREDSGYVHIKFNHGQGQFGYGLSSTSHIESLWEF